LGSAKFFEVILGSATSKRLKNTGLAYIRYKSNRLFQLIVSASDRYNYITSLLKREKERESEKDRETERERKREREREKERERER
jgi:hypothetical protein